MSKNEIRHHRAKSRQRLTGNRCSNPNRTTWALRWPRQFVLAAALGIVTCLPGCSVWHLAHRTLYSELSQYPQVTDGKLSCRQYRRWAKDEWQRVIHETGGRGYSSDYASGFIQGFVDQVYAGGNVQAPAMPPRKYWRVGYRNERGRRAVEEWYDGFRHGARTANEGGYRDEAVIPSSLWDDRESVLDERPPVRSAAEDIEPPEPTPAEVPQSPETLDPVPPPIPQGPVQDVSNELSWPVEVTDGDRQDPAPAMVQPTVYESEQQQNSVPLPEDAGPPPPPWHKPATADASSAAARSTEPRPPDLEFDPFAGTAFQPALGLAPPTPTAEPTLVEEATLPLNRELPAIDSTREAPQDRPDAHSEGTEALGWQQAPPPPSSWKRRQ